MSVGWSKKGLLLTELDEFMDFNRQSSSHLDFIILDCGANDITDQITELQLAENIRCTLLRYNACSKIQN